MTLKEILKDNCEVRSYSGRGMFGKQCIGVETNSVAVILQELAVVIMEEVAQVVSDNHGCDDEPVHEEDRDLMRSLFDYRTDNMGLGMIVYWPRIEYVETNVENDDE